MGGVLVFNQGKSGGSRFELFPLNGFDTKYLQQRYFRQNFNYLVGSLAQN